jgi:D-sedoheptulose 7-phosphate isomerase
MTGYEGGKLRATQQAGIYVPLADMGMVESIHVCLLHWIVDDVFARINQEGRYGR